MELLKTKSQKNNKKRKKFSKKTKLNIISQIVINLKYLHSKKIIYRNLLPKNITITKKGYIKLKNFQNSKKLKKEKNKTYTLLSISSQYLSPEILLNKGYTNSVDFWNLGIFIYEFITNINPFIDSDPMKIYENILTNKIFFLRSFLDKEIFVIRKLLCLNPK